MILVPDGAAAGAGFGGTGIPHRHAPTVRIPGAEVHVLLGHGTIGAAELLDVTAGMVDAHAAFRSDVALVPSGPVGVVGGRRDAAQAQEGHVGAHVVHQQFAARHGLVDWGVLGGVAHGALPVEAEDPILHIGTKAVVCGEEVGDGIAGTVVHQRTCAESIATGGDDGHCADLIAPVVGIGADDVDVAFAAVPEAAVTAEDVAVGVRDLSDHQGALAGHRCGFVVFDGDAVPGQLRYGHTGATGAAFAGEGTQLLARFIVDIEQGSLRQFVGGELEVDGVGIRAMEGHAPEPIAVGQGVPAAIAATAHIRVVVEAETPGALVPVGITHLILREQGGGIHDREGHFRHPGQLGGTGTKTPCTPPEGYLCERGIGEETERQECGVAVHHGEVASTVKIRRADRMREGPDLTWTSGPSPWVA